MLWRCCDGVIATSACSQNWPWMALYRSQISQSSTYTSEQLMNRKSVMPCFCRALQVNSSATILEYPPRMSTASKQDCTSASNARFNMVQLCSSHLCWGSPSSYTSPFDLKHRRTESSDLVTTSTCSLRPHEIPLSSWSIVCSQGTRTNWDSFHAFWCILLVLG